MAILKISQYLGTCCAYNENMLNFDVLGERVYVQLFELWPIAKFVLKQIIKAHGPLVIMSHEVCMTLFHKVLHYLFWCELFRGSFGIHVCCKSAVA